jgi:hypothetical protein
METYNLRIITKWLKQKDIEYTYLNNNYGNIYEHGVRIPLDGDFELRIHTHTNICFDAFCQTALLYKSKIIFILDYYSDVLHHYSPEELFNHIDNMTEKIKKLNRQMTEQHIEDLASIYKENILRITEEINKT